MIGYLAKALRKSIANASFSKPQARTILYLWSGYRYIYPLILDEPVLSPEECGVIGLSMTVVDRFRLSGSPSYFMLHQRLVASFINQLSSKCRCIPADDSLKLLRSAEDASQIQGRDKNHWSLTLYLAQFPVELLIISHSCTNCQLHRDCTWHILSPRSPRPWHWWASWACVVWLTDIEAAVEGCEE